VRSAGFHHASLGPNANPTAHSCTVASSAPAKSGARKAIVPHGCSAGNGSFIAMRQVCGLTGDPGSVRLRYALPTPPDGAQPPARKAPQPLRLPEPGRYRPAPRAGLSLRSCRVRPYRGWRVLLLRVPVPARLRRRLVPSGGDEMTWKPPTDQWSWPLIAGVCDMPGCPRESEFFDAARPVARSAAERIVADAARLCEYHAPHARYRTTKNGAYVRGPLRP